MLTLSSVNFSTVSTQSSFILLRYVAVVVVTVIFTVALADPGGTSSGSDDPAPWTSHQCVKPPSIVLIWAAIEVVPYDK